MTPLDFGLGVLVAALWGFNFVTIHVALAHVAPLLLAAARFAVAALPVLVLPRPAVPWPRMVALAATLFIAQFVFLFSGMRVGMPAGLASVVCQSQAVFTTLLAWWLLRERLGGRKLAGLAVAAAGLALIGTTVGTAGFTGAGLALTLLSAVCWAVGNILLRRVGPVDTPALIAWLSLIPPVPLLLGSLVFEGPGAIPAALDGPVWLTGAAVLYLGVGATIAGYGIWGRLLRRYPASTVAPFSLLVPPFGLFSAWLLLDEAFEPWRLAGIGLVVAGLAFGTLPVSRRWGARPRASTPAGPRV